MPYDQVGPSDGNPGAAQCGHDLLVNAVGPADVVAEREPPDVIDDGLPAATVGAGIAVAPSELRKLQSTGLYHMPLCLAWRGHPSVINPSDTSHIRRKTDRLDAQKLAQHSLNGLWRESWMAPDPIQELRVLAIQRGKLVGERSRLSNRINGDLLRFGHTIGQVGPINGSVVRPLIEDFCRNGQVGLHGEFFSDVAIPPGVLLVFNQRRKPIDELHQEIKTIEQTCINQVDSQEWCLGDGRRVLKLRFRPPPQRGSHKSAQGNALGTGTRE